MRINKYLASAGIASRRKADELIANGNVRVNGARLTEPGYDVKEDDLVEVNGKVVVAEDKKYYIMLNKPEGFVTTVSDEHDRPTVMELVKEIPARIYPVGRLDYNTSGLLIMTNDGDFAYKVSHPKHELGKTYRAYISGFLSKGKVAALEKGVDIGGFVTSPSKVKIIKEMERSSIVEITIHEGKYHQVRKMFAQVGCQVQELQRIAIGDVILGRLALGGYRNLTQEEIKMLLSGNKAGNSAPGGNRKQERSQRDSSYEPQRKQSRKGWAKSKKPSKGSGINSAGAKNAKTTRGYSSKKSK